MNKNTFTAIPPEKGEMNVYDFGGIRLHAYKTNDLISNEVSSSKRRARRSSSNRPASLTTSVS